MADTVTLSRDELYAQVWSTPMVRLAAQLGVSDVGLAKTCRRMQIPLPGLGYWARKAAGQVLRRTPLKALPPESSRWLNSATFNLRRVEQKQNLTHGPLAAIAAFEQLPENALLVNASARLNDPVLKQTANALKASSVNDYHLHKTRGAGFLNIAVARDTIPRAMAITAALVAGFKKRSWRLAPPTRDDGYTGVSIQGQLIQFHLREHTSLVPEAEQKRVDPWRGGVYVPQPNPRYRPSGRLTLSIDSPWPEGMRKSWKDGENQRLEECLNEFMLTLAACALDMKRIAAEREEEHRRWLAAEREREERARRQAEEAARVVALRASAATWAESQQLRSFLTALRDRIPEGEHDADRDRWIEWATAYAMGLDPLNGPLSVLWQGVAGRARPQASPEGSAAFRA